MHHSPQLSFRFGYRLEPRQRLAPESVDPVTKYSDARRVQLVEVSRAVSPMGDETCVLEDAKMLRHGGSAHGKSRRKVADRSRAGPEQLEDLSSRRVAQCVERVTVSNHLP